MGGNPRAGFPRPVAASPARSRRWGARTIARPGAVLHHAAIATARHRLIALGASNLARGMLALLDAARTAASGPVDAHAALGWGRSYGIPSTVLGRGLGGIAHGGLWAALADSPPAPATAVLMDVGNDLLYGVEVARLLGWVESALQRLTRAGACCHVIGLPMATIRTLTNWRYRLVRSVLVPRCRLSLRELQQRAEATHQGLAALARVHGAAFHELPERWFGFDPVHFAQRHWPGAARGWLGVDGAAAAPEPRANGRFARVCFLGAVPAVRTWFGRERRHPQPAWRWADGTTLSLW